MARARRPSKREHLIDETGPIQLVWTSGGQRVEQRPANRRRILDQASQLGGGLRIDMGQRGVENLDFQAKPGPGPFEQLRQRSGQHRYLKMPKEQRRDDAPSA